VPDACQYPVLIGILRIQNQQESACRHRAFQVKLDLRINLAERSNHFPSFYSAVAN